MSKKIHVTEKAPAPVGPYSQAVEVNNFLFCSGQIPLDAQSGEMLQESIEEETQKVMANVSEVLKAANLNFENIIKTTIFLTDLNDFTKVNEVYASYFKNEPPARSCVEVSKLPKGANVEIEVLAHR